MIKLKDVGNSFIGETVYDCISYSYSKESHCLNVHNVLSMVKEDKVFGFIKNQLRNESVAKVVILAKGSVFADLGKPAILVYEYEKEGLKVLPKINQYIKYRKDGLEKGETIEVVHIDHYNQLIGVQHIWNDMGRQVEYLGIPFSEYFDSMEIDNA